MLIRGGSQIVVIDPRFVTLYRFINNFVSLIIKFFQHKTKVSWQLFDLAIRKSALLRETLFCHYRTNLQMHFNFKKCYPTIFFHNFLSNCFIDDCRLEAYSALFKFSKQLQLELYHGKEQAQNIFLTKFYCCVKSFYSHSKWCQESHVFQARQIECTSKTTIAITKQLGLFNNWSLRFTLT